MSSAEGVTRPTVPERYNAQLRPARSGLHRRETKNYPAATFAGHGVVDSALVAQDFNGRSPLQYRLEPFFPLALGNEGDARIAKFVFGARQHHMDRAAAPQHCFMEQ